MYISSDTVLEDLFSQARLGVGVCGVNGRLQEFSSALDSDDGSCSSQVLATGENVDQ